MNRVNRLLYDISLSSHIWVTGELTSNNESSFIYFRGIDPLTDWAIPLLERYIINATEDFSWKNFSNNSVVLSEYIANLIGLQIGDNFTIVFQQDDNRIRTNLTLTAIYDIPKIIHIPAEGLSFHPAFINIKFLQKVLNVTDLFNAITVKVYMDAISLDDYRVEVYVVLSTLAEIIASRANNVLIYLCMGDNVDTIGSYNSSVIAYGIPLKYELLRSIDEYYFRVTDEIIELMLVSSIFIATIMVYTISTYYIKKREREYSILRVLGVSKNVVKGMIVNELMFIGALGIIIGFLITPIFVYLFYYVYHMFYEWAPTISLDIVWSCIDKLVQNVLFIFGITYIIGKIIAYIGTPKNIIQSIQEKKVVLIEVFEIGGKKKKLAIFSLAFMIIYPILSSFRNVRNKLIQDILAPIVFPNQFIGGILFIVLNFWIPVIAVLLYIALAKIFHNLDLRHFPLLKFNMAYIMYGDRRKIYSFIILALLLSFSIILYHHSSKIRVQEELKYEQIINGLYQLEGYSYAYTPEIATKIMELKHVTHVAAFYREFFSTAFMGAVLVNAVIWQDVSSRSYSIGPGGLMVYLIDANTFVSLWELVLTEDMIISGEKNWTKIRNLMTSKENNFIIISEALALDYNITIRTSFDLVIQETPLDLWHTIPNVTILSVLKNEFPLLEWDCHSDYPIIMDYHHFYKFYNESFSECRFLIGTERNNINDTEILIKNAYPHMIIYNRVAEAITDLKNAESFSLLLISMSLFPPLVAMLGYLLNYYFYMLERKKELGILVSMGTSYKDLFLLVLIDILFTHFVGLMIALIVDFIFLIYMPNVNFLIMGTNTNVIYGSFLVDIRSYPIFYALFITIVCVFITFLVSYAHLKSFLKDSVIPTLRNT